MTAEEHAATAETHLRYAEGHLQPTEEHLADAEVHLKLVKAPPYRSGGNGACRNGTP
jgi:hypothetical protein